jgi:hypothetical protein
MLLLLRDAIEAITIDIEWPLESSVFD